MALEIKMFEIRDRMTTIPAMAIKGRPSGVTVEDMFLRRAGFGPGCGAVILLRLADAKARIDPYEWDDRTMKASHVYIEQHFDELTSGQVVDVRVVLGEEKTPVEPEIVP